MALSKVWDRSAGTDRLGIAISGCTSGVARPERVEGRSSAAETSAALFFISATRLPAEGRLVRVEVFSDVPESLVSDIRGKFLWSKKLRQRVGAKITAQMQTALKQ